MHERRPFAPEFVQTSAMDCGPASLTCLLAGFGVPVSYGRLREACQTDVDGTSIDTIEEVARQLGLHAEQTMVPPDHLLLPEAAVLPALVVVWNPDRTTHFVVVWRRHGPFVQVMDPAVGRRWLPCETFLRDLYLHAQAIPAEAWRAWAGTEGFVGPVSARLRALGVPSASAERMLSAALTDDGWRGAGALDAATRMVEDLATAGGVRRGTEAERLVGVLIGSADSAIPEAYWSVRPSPSVDGTEMVTLHGAVLLHVAGRSAASDAVTLPRVLQAALDEAPPRPGRDLLRMLRADGALAPAALVVGLLIAGAGVFVEALLFRGLFDLGRDLGLARQRFIAVGALLAFLVALLLVERPVLEGALRLGRHLEARFRTAFLEKLPRLGDRYFQSRPVSDMAERSHSLHHLRQLPMMGAQLVRAGFELLLTTAGIVWLDPAAAPAAIAAAALAVGWPLMMQPGMAERDLRLRTHTGALGRFYLDALLGLTAVRTHGAETSVRREHEGLLVEWSRAGLRLNRTSVALEAGQIIGGFALAAWILEGHLARSGSTGAALLMAYWALYIPVLGQEAAGLVRQYPLLRSTTLRLLEPLAAPEDESSEPAADATPRDDLASDLGGGRGRPSAPLRRGAGAHRPVAEPQRTPLASAVAAPTPQRGIELRLEHVTVRAGGHTILDQIGLEVPAGQHVAIVGPSGAGKSSLIGLLLGWHRPSSGRVLVDGEALAGGRLDALLRDTAWVDPSVQLWNTSLFDNLTYSCGASNAVSDAVAGADLLEILEKMTDGLQTKLGESGRRVSGGEGQRVRFARALLQRDARLVLLDEPFRGLDGSRRRALLARARGYWKDATLLCVTHDLAETTGFDRVIVIEGGVVTEDGSPEELLRRPDSRYRTLVEREREVKESVWSATNWRRLRLTAGRLLTVEPVDGALTPAPATTPLSIPMRATRDVEPLDGARPDSQEIHEHESHGFAQLAGRLAR